MEKFEIPTFDDDGLYLTRWRIIQTPIAAIYLHRLDAPDSRPTLHDHPWPFLSLVLRGGYTERRLSPLMMTVDEHHVIRRFNFMAQRDAHAILSLRRTPTWTLLFVGPRTRTWGYWEPVGHMDGGVPFEDMPRRFSWRWTEYDQHPHAKEFDASLARRRARGL
jgi:hypothetical protein